MQLTDTGTDTRVSIAPSIAFRMIVKGHDVLRWPHADMAAFKANPNQTGQSQFPTTSNCQFPTEIRGERLSLQYFP